MTSLFGKTPIDNNKGFSLVELLLVLALIGIALAGAFQFFGFTNLSYARADAQSAVIQEVNLFFNQIERDIRSASEPNNLTKSVRILDSGNGLDIYRYNNTTKEYERISYRINPNDLTKLQRGIATSSDKDYTADPQYATIPNNGDGAWKNIVSDVLSVTFSDRNPSDTISSRRLVDIAVFVKPPELKDSIAMQTAIMTRTGKSTTSIASTTTELKYVPVTGIVITPSSWNLGGPAATQTFTATVVPSNATNKTLIWSQDFGSDLGNIEIPVPGTNKVLKYELFEPFVKFQGYSLDYDDGTMELLEDYDLPLDGYYDRMVTRSGSQVQINVSQNPIPGGVNLLGGIFPIPIDYTRPATIKVRLASPTAGDFSGSTNMIIKQSNDGNPWINL